MVFGNMKQTKYVTFNFNAQAIQQVSQYKYVGVIFNSQDPVFNEQCSMSTVKNSYRALFKVAAYCKCLGQIPPVLAVKLFNSLVTPILIYGSEIWYPVVNHQLKDRPAMFQLQFLKSVK